VRRVNGRWLPRLEALESRHVPAPLAHGPNVDVSQAPGNDDETTIASDPTHPTHLFASSNSDVAGLFAAVSTDAGQTWSRRNIATGSDGLPPAISDPQAVFDHFGNLYLAYVDTALGVTILVSTDGGQTFRELIDILDGGADQPSIAVGPNSLWVSYAGGNGMLNVAGIAVAGLGAFGTFSTPQPVPGSQNGNFGDIAVGPAGQVMVTYQNSTTGTGPDNIMVNTNPTGLGGAFGAPVVATATNVGAIDTALPAQSNNFGIDAEANLAWDRSGGPHSGRVYLVYTDAAAVGSLDTDIFVRFSDNNGASWSPQVRVNDVATGSQFLPSIVVDQTSGAVAVQWYDTRNDRGMGGSGDTNNGTPDDDAELFAAISVDFGQTFPNIQVTPTASNSADSEPPILGRPLGYGDYEKTTAFTNGMFFAVWADNSNSTGNNPDGMLHRMDVYTALVQVQQAPPPPPPPPKPVTPASVIVAGVDEGAFPVITAFDPKTSVARFSIMVYSPAFRGGVRVAVANVTGGSTPDIITAPGPGGGPDIKVFSSATGQLEREFLAYDPRFSSGVFIAAADVNGDGRADIITAPGTGGGPEVKVFSGADNALLFDFMAYSPFFAGGVNVAAGDVDGDGRADIITGAGPGGGPHVKIFSGATGTEFAGSMGSFMAFDPRFSGGVSVAAGDINADGRADIVVGAGVGGAPHVKVFDGRTGLLISSFFAGPIGTLFQGDGAPFRAGLRVSSFDLLGAGRDDVAVSFGPLHDPSVLVFDPLTTGLLDDFFAFPAAFRGGVFVGGG
jgi:hypothetical protein